MKTWKLALACLLTFAVFVGMTFVPTIMAKTIKAGVNIEPHRVDLGSQIPPEIIAIIWLKGPYKVDQIDPTTILMEGYLPPLWAEVRLVEDGSYRFFAGFYGPSVETILWSKISHMGITTPNPNAPAKIELDITGNLLPEYDGTPFEGTGGYLKVIIPLTNPPPPP